MCKKLQNHPFSSTISTFFVFSLFFLPLLQGTPHNTFIYGGCSETKYQSQSPFEANLNSLVTSMISSSSQSSYNSFAAGNDTSAPPDAAVYGLYQCRGDLSVADCSKCIQNAVGQMSLLCSYAYSADLQLEGCFVRYENENFLGKLDTTLVFKKCSPSSSNDEEFFRRRDDVLADLQAGVGFRVHGSGLVQGYAQCLGDLGSTDCSSCLSAAAGTLKNVCGSASAADVYLGKCYARYWASGYYSPSSIDSSNEDEVGRTVAIIVGVVAGLAFVIVLLSFLRKALG